MHEVAIKSERKLKLYGKYVVSGLSAASVQFFFLFIFHGLLKLWIALSASIAFVFAFFVSFYLQKFWTFRDHDRNKIWRQMSLYLIVGLCNLAINAIGMHILVDRLGVWYMLAQVMLGGMIAIEGFLVYKKIIFKKKRLIEFNDYEVTDK